MLAVVDGERLVGVFSVRDIVTRVGTAYAAKRTRPVREFMTPNPETLPPDAPINFAINMMDVGGYRHVPIVQHGHLLGVVSTREVIKYLIRHGPDRKSTRLNSSHANISYAVFCLKKTNTDGATRHD